MLSWAESQFNRAKTERTPFEREWFGNLSFYFGQHWVQWVRSHTGTYAELKIPEAPPWRVRMTVNLIKPKVRKEIARLLKERPNGVVVPSSTDDADVFAAFAAEQIRDYLWRELKATRVFRHATFWSVLTGTGFIKDYWSPAEADSAGLPGKICLERVSPWHLFVGDLQQENIEDQPWVIHTTSKDVSWVKKVYDVDVKPDGKASAAVWETQMLRGLGLAGTKTPDNSVLVKEAWIKDAPFFKDGGRIVWANGRIISVDEGLPYDYNCYPFTKIDHTETGRFYSQGFVTDLIPLQREYNRTRSQIIEAKNRMSKPQLIAQKGAVDVSRITSEPGLIIQYQPGLQPPVPLPLQNLPTYVIQELDRSQMDMNDIASQHEITKGQSPPGVEAATAISFLQEQDDSAISNALSSIEFGTERVSRHLLSHVVQYWDIPRMVRVTGPNGVFEANELKGSDVASATDWRVLEGSAVPRSYAAKQAFILDLMKNQFVSPEDGLKHLNVAETDSLYEEMQQDFRQATRENLSLFNAPDPEEAAVLQAAKEIEATQANLPPGSERMSPQQVLRRALASLTPKPNEFDNDLAHIKQHEGFAKSQQFRQMSPVKQQMHLIHNKLHMQKYAMEAGVELDFDDPRLVGFIKGHGAPPPFAVEDANQAPVGGVQQ